MNHKDKRPLSTYATGASSAAAGGMYVAGRSYLGEAGVVMRGWDVDPDGTDGVVGMYVDHADDDEDADVHGEDGDASAISDMARALAESTAMSPDFENLLHCRRGVVLSHDGDEYHTKGVYRLPGVPCNSVPSWFADLDDMQLRAIRSLPVVAATEDMHALLKRIDHPDPAPRNAPVSRKFDPATVVKQVPALIAALGSLHLVARVLATGEFVVDADGSDSGTYTVRVRCPQRFKPERVGAVADHFRQLVMSAYVQADPMEFKEMAEVMFHLGHTDEEAALARLDAAGSMRRDIEVLVARLASVDPNELPHGLRPCLDDASKPVVDAAERVQQMIAQMAGVFEQATRQDVGATWLYRRVLSRIIRRAHDVQDQYQQTMNDFPLGRYDVQVTRLEEEIEDRINKAVEASEHARSAAVFQLDTLQDRVRRLEREKDDAGGPYREEIKGLRSRIASHEAATTAAILERDAAKREADVLGVSLQMRDETIARMTSKPVEAALREEIESLRRVNASLAGDQRARSVAHEQIVESERQATERANRLDAELKDALKRARGLSQQLQLSAKEIQGLQEQYDRLYASAYPAQSKSRGDTLTSSDGDGSVEDVGDINGRFTMLEID